MTTFIDDSGFEYDIPRGPIGGLNAEVLVTDRLKNRRRGPIVLTDPGPIVSPLELEIEAAAARIKALKLDEFRRPFLPIDVPTPTALRKADKLAARLGARIDFLTAERRRILTLAGELNSVELTEAYTHLRIAQNHLENARDSLR